jgi:SagB-type dehydrogenase family enzyme
LTVARSEGIRLRRSPWIVSYWEKRTLIYHNYLSRTRISAAPVTSTILDFFSDWRHPSELALHLTQFSATSVHRTIRQLAAASFLEVEGYVDPRSSAMQAWRNWSPAADFFHFTTKDVKYQIEPTLDDRAIRRHILRDPQPPFFKRYPHSTVIPLPSDDSPAESEFLNVLLRRRTWREFGPAKLTLDALARILSLTWGVRKLARIKFLGPVPLKTSPSAGARHPIEGYVIASRVEDLPPGIYHYSSDLHRLEFVKKAPTKKRLIRYLGGQWWYGEAPAVFIMTAVFPRNMWKYTYPRSYRSVLLDAGHLCQTLCLVATWLGLAPFCTAALADSLIERDLEIDGITESAIYAAGVGVQPRV